MMLPSCTTSSRLSHPRALLMLMLICGLCASGCGDDAEAAAIDDLDVGADVADVGSGSDLGDVVVTEETLDGIDVNDPVDAGDADAGGEPWAAAREGCNGHHELCERRYDEVVFPGTHNSMSNAAERWTAPNQNLPLRAQLNDGVRVFLLDTYDERGELLLCHAYCILGSRPLIDAMVELRSFFDANPDEVVTIIFEDHIPAAKTAQVIEEAGLLELVYTHDEQAGWPTLGEMIEANTRLVITAESAGPPPAWLHHVWNVGWDTPYSFAAPEEFNCNANRGSTSHDLFLVNHWVLNPLPNPATAETVNTYEMLMARIEECRERWDRLPTFIAIDFHDIGDLFEVVDVLNGVRAGR